MSKELTEEVIAFLIDLDGVLYEDNRLIPGAVEAIAYLQEKGCAFRFATHTTIADLIKYV